MGLVDFIDLANANFLAEERYWDRQYQLTAWSTALLMNATGNYGNRQIKPTDLYRSPYEDTTEQSSKQVNKKYVEDEQAKLKAMFGL